MHSDSVPSVQIVGKRANGKASEKTRGDWGDGAPVRPFSLPYSSRLSPLSERLERVSKRTTVTGIFVFLGQNCTTVINYLVL